MNADRTLPGDWYPGKIPPNVILDEGAYLETTFSFHLFRSEVDGAVKCRRGASVYLGTMFDVGPKGRVEIGEYSLVNGARIICDAEIIIGDYALISWNVVFMDTYRFPFNINSRRQQLERFAQRQSRASNVHAGARPIRLERNVWVGFDACVMPGVTIGEGSVVGAKSVVFEDVPAFTAVAGNPARVIRKLPGPP